ncbi:hypothetical protein GobsT_23480 [Gemmata obscuriglobus]|nr:hypothetical protein GobsT_23480 [Gemmata obscuriglobus]VTS04701.1 unnamed protein product [Gemmata obscuriglobus UQM 2246]
MLRTSFKVMILLGVSTAIGCGSKAEPIPTNLNQSLPKGVAGSGGPGPKDGGKAKAPQGGASEQ